MKKNVLTFFAVLLAATLCASAQTNIAGTYKGTLTVTVLMGDADSDSFENTKIIVTEELGGTYKLSVLNFIFADIVIGDLDVTGISASEENGEVILSKAGSSVGPLVDIGPITVNTFIYLNSASISSEGQLILSLSVTGNSEFMEEGEEEPVADVEFTGDITTGIFSPKAETIAIYPTIVDEVITVTGFETANYAIYTQNGALVKAGNVNNGIINAANLGTGIYFLNINGASAKFIKK